MTLTVATLLTWRPADLDTAAAELEAARRAVVTAVGDLEAVGRALADDWTGEAGPEAIAVVRRHARTGEHIAETLSLVRRTLGAASDALVAARDLLARAQAYATERGLRIEADGRVLVPSAYVTSTDPTVSAAAAYRHQQRLAAGEQAQALARQALAAATEADADAARALRVAWVASVDGSSWDAADTALVAAVTGRDLPEAGTSPTEVAAWWASLSLLEQTRLLGHSPELLGNLDGVPVAVRDRANQRLLARELTDAEARLAELEAEVAAALDGVTDRLSAQQAQALMVQRDAALAHLEMLEVIRDQVAGGPDRSLMAFEATMPGRAAIAIGDVDTADHVAVLVPGLNSYVTNYLENITGNAVRVQQVGEGVFEAQGSGETVATIAWIGYRAPDYAEVAFTSRAETGAKLLTETLGGIEATRAARGGQVHLTTLGHSYGSLVSGLTAAEYTPMDDLVLFGSPGVGTDSVDGLALPADRVFVGEAARDVVADLDRFGTDPVSEGFGAVGFDTNGGPHPLGGNDTLKATGHSEYYRADTESLWNIVAVVIGQPENLTHGRNQGIGDWLL